MHYIITGGDRLVVDSPLDSMTTNSQKMIGLPCFILEGECNVRGSKSAQQIDDCTF